MKTLPLNLADLSPQEATLELASLPGTKLTLCKWSLRVRVWAITKYGENGLKEILSKQMISEIADLAYFMLKEKNLFADQDAFLDAVCSVQDQINVIKALLKTIGIGEPEIEKIGATLPQAQAPTAPAVKKKKSIGAKYLTR